MTEETRIRLNIVSEVALEGGNPRPIHMFKPGTFTDMAGRENSFTQDDVLNIVSHFNANRRRKPPITERHDFGQAIGRLQNVWADKEGNLFGMPKWNAKGRALLEDEIYDGFSCELDKGDTGWMLIGGSLTNYPAVDGLEPVTLTAPPLVDVSHPSAVEETQVLSLEPTQSWDELPISTLLADIQSVRASLMAPTAPMSQARPDIDVTTQEHNPMDDIQTDGAPSVPLPVALPPISDAAMQAQISAYVGQMEARYQAQQEAAFQRAQQEFERRISEMEARRQIESFAQDATTATLQRQHALPCTTDELTSLLAETPTAIRSKWQTLISRTLDAGLVDFSEHGSQGDGDARNEREQYQALVEEEVRGGKTRLDAIKAVNRSHPELYEAQRTAKGGR